MSMIDKIIIMLTHNDKTVKDAIEIFEENKDLPIQYWGFKDVGMEPEKMKVLCKKTVHSFSQSIGIHPETIRYYRQSGLIFLRYSRINL